MQRLDRESDDARFERLALLLFEQAVLAEGRQLEDPAAFVNRLNELLVELGPSCLRARERRRRTARDAKTQCRDVAERRGAGPRGHARSGDRFGRCGAERDRRDLPSASARARHDAEQGRDDARARVRASRRATACVSTSAASARRRAAMRTASASGPMRSRWSAWSRARWPGLRLYLGGFSFGGGVALASAAEARPFGLVTVAPPVEKLPPTFVPPSCPWLLVHGTADDVVPVAPTEAWVAALAAPPQLVLLDGVGHFFHGQLRALERCRDCVSSPPTFERGRADAQGAQRLVRSRVRRQGRRARRPRARAADRDRAATDRGRARGLRGRSRGRRGRRRAR